MRKKWPVLSILILLALFFYMSLHIREKEKQSSDAKQNGPYFQKVKVTRFSIACIPCIDIEIEGKSIEVKLDLGSNHHLVLPKEAINNFKSKSFLDTTPIYSFRGNKFQLNRYIIPSAKINKMNLSDLQTIESNLELANDGIIGEKISVSEEGEIGWVSFYHLNLFLDCKHSTIAFCDSFDTLKKRGRLKKAFVEAPLSLQDKLIAFDVETEKGKLHCILDTGCTRNFLNADVEIPDEKVDHSENTEEFSAFKINSVDFGRMEFRRLPIKLPIKVDAILGMDFIYSRQIFIDFSKRKIYFSVPKEELNLSSE